MRCPKCSGRTFFSDMDGDLKTEPVCLNCGYRQRMPPLKLANVGVHHNRSTIKRRRAIERQLAGYKKEIEKEYKK